MLRELFEQINLTGQTVQVSNGGTGAATAADARTNLSVYSIADTDALIAQAIKERAIWGYQDFIAGDITSTSVTLTTNSNGTSAVFDVAKLISSSASLFRQDGISYAFTGTTSLFSSKITVASQVGATITLSGIPNASWGTVRIWYQILSTVYPQNYQNPPLTVQTTVVTALGALFEEQENKVTDFTVVNDILYPSALAVSTALALKQSTSAKDTTGGYAGLTLFKINFKNAANTFTSFFTNANTAARTYTFQDRDGTILDSTDLSTLNTSIATKQTIAKDTTGGYAGLTLFKINFKNAANTFTSFFTNSNTAARTYTFQNRDGTILDGTDLGTINTSLSTKQDANLNLTSLASLTLPVDGLLYSSGANTITTSTVTAAARTVLDDTTVAAMVDTLGGATSTGSGGLVRATSPVLVTPALGAPASGNLANCTGYAANNLPAGVPIQIVPVVKTDTASTASSTYAAIPGITATITPGNVNNKVRVTIVLQVGGAAGARGNFQVFRGATKCNHGTAGSSRSQDSAVYYCPAVGALGSVVIDFVDSPATIAATTYTVQWSSPDNVSTILLNRTLTDTNSALFSRTASNITLTEIRG